MNTIQNKLAGRMMAGRDLLSVRCQLALLALGLLVGPVARAVPDGTFSAPFPIDGLWGSTSVDNSTYTADPGTPNIAGYLPYSPVWYQFTATNDGEVAIDTIGSLDLFGLQLDTTVAVFSGTNLASLYQVAANDDLYPSKPWQFNYANQNTYLKDTNSGAVTATSQLYPYYQPFVGPSGLRFNAKRGTSYYIAADTLYNNGTIALNWAYHSSGVVRFASENVEQTGITDISGNPVLLYQCAATEGQVLVTVTRVGGYTGRMTVDYTTVDGDPTMLTNGDQPAVGGVDYTTTAGTLTFDDFEMSKTISIPVFSFGFGANPNHDFTVALSNAQLDPQESTDVSAPRIDPVFGQALVRILNMQASPFGARAVVDTNGPVPVTNYVTGDAFNFGRVNYRLQRPINTNTTYTYLLTISRTGANNNATNIYYQVNSGYPFFPNNPGNMWGTLQNMRFPLQPGSDYATPSPAGSGDGVFDTSPDFTVAGGSYSGTISWADKDRGAKTLAITLYNNGKANFNEDFHIELYAKNADGGVYPKDVGMVGETTVTMLYQDQNPPAGSVDEKINADYNLDLLNMQITTTPPRMAHPGTDGQVYGVAVQSDNKTVIVGDFYSYNGFDRNCIARINTDGSLDTSFNPGTGVDAVPGFNFPPIFINAVALDTNNNKILIAGSFSSYNGSPRANVARLNSDGSLDGSFNPGAGAAGPVYAILLQADGKIMIGGAFTNYNGYSVKNLARLNSDGSFDNSFNPGNALNASVYALAEQNGTFINASRNASGGQARDDNVVNVGAPSGILTVDYDFLAQPDDMRVYYGSPTNGVLIYDTGFISFTGHLVIPFGPTNGLTFNFITIVMNETGGQFGTLWSYTASVQSSFANQLYVGGDFTSVGGIAHQDHLARILGDGSVDTTFDPNAGVNGPVYALAVQPDGNILAGGEFTQVNDLDNNRLVRLTTTGALDTNFLSGVGVDGTVFNLNLQADGTIYVGGAFTSVNGTHRLGFARLYSNGTVDTSFLDSAYNQFAGLPRKYFSDPLGTVFSSGVQSDGGIMIGGSFDEVGGGQYDANIRSDSNLGAYRETFTRDAIRNRSNVARLIGGGTPGPGNVGLLVNSYSVNKSGSAIFVSLLRTNGSLGISSANFSVLPGMAQSGSDFSYSSPAPAYPWLWENSAYPFYSRMHSDGLYGTNTFISDAFGNYYNATGWAPSSLVTVTIFKNSNSSGNLGANFQLANPANSDQFYLGGQNIPLGVALGASAAPLTIVDDQHQSGVVEFAAASYVGSTGSSPIGVIRTNGNYGLVSVHYTTVTNGSTAVLGSDYNFSSGTLNLLNGVSSNSFYVNVLRSNYVSSVEKFVNLQLSSLQAPANGIASLGLSDAVLRIINPNFAGYLNFNTNDYEVNLSAGFAYVTVTRTVGSKGTLTASVVTADGTALNGTDYAGSTNLFQWNNGDVSSRVIAVPLINHTNLGGPLQFTVNLVNPALTGTNTLSLLGPTPTATVTINNDNNYGTVQFQTAAYTVNENGGVATLTVTRTGSTLGDASVDFTTADVSAVAGNNYTYQSGTLHFAPGQTTTNIQISIIDDGVVDNLAPADFYFQVSLYNPGAGVSLGVPDLAAVHLVDASAYIRPPGSGDVTFNADPGINGAVFALAQQANGQLIAGGNFTTVNGSARNNLARLNTDGTTDVTGFLYGLSGVNSAVYALANQSDDRVLLGGLFTTVNGVVRNRIARVMTDGSLDTSFNPGVGADNAVYSLAQTVVGGSQKIYVAGTFLTFNAVNRPFVVRLNGNGSVDGSFNPGIGPNGTVYAVAAYPTNSPFAGKVLIGGAFTNVNNFSAPYLARLNADGSLDTNFVSSLNVSGIVRALAIQTDDGILIGGDFTSVGSTASAHLARIYDHSGVAVLDTNFSTAMSAGPNGRVDAIVLQADNRIVVAGEFSRANGVTRNNITRLKADGSVDPTINFGSGANAAVYAALVQPADQLLVLGGAFTQYNDQSHNHIVRVYGGSQLGSGSFEFTATNYVAAENGLHAFISVRRIGGTMGTNTVDFASSDLTAVNGTNYLGTTNTLIFPPGEVLQVVTLPVMDDGIITPDLTVALNLSNTAGYGDQTNAVLTIQNVESAVLFSAANYYVAHNSLTGRANIDVIRLGTTNGTAAVNFITTTNGTAVSGVDFTPVNVTLTFNPGESDKLVQIPVLPSGVLQGDLTVLFTLSNAVNTVLYYPSNATLTIRGTNGPGVIGFLTNSLVVSEGDTNAYLTVIRTNGSAGIASVFYTTTPGSAVAGINYNTQSGTLAFGDGETNKTIIVPLIDNNLVQGPVNFTVNLSSVAGSTLSTDTQMSVTILDNDAGIAFAATTNSAPEDAGFVGVVVQRLYNVALASSVNYATADGTALAGINYSNTSGTLNFTNGEVFKSINVPLIHDTNASGDLTFALRLTSPVNAQLVAPSNTVVVVQDAEAGITFTTNSQRVLKNSGFAVVTVVCANPRVEPVIYTTNDVPLTVSFTTRDGTAKAGTDYQALSGTLVFTNGLVTNTFSVPIYNNSLLNGDLAFTVALTNVTAPGVLTPITTQSVVIAESNSGLRFSQSAYTVFKNGIFKTIEVFRTGYTDSVVSVNFLATNGTALAGVNFVSTNGTLVFTNGVTSRTFNVPLIANTKVQPNLIVQLQLSSPTNGLLVKPAQASLTILENGGSFVIPAGSQVVTNYTSHASDGIISSNDVVQVLFAFRDSAGLNVANLMAVLQRTNGVIPLTSGGAVLNYETNAYGPLTVYGHSASSAYYFQAQGTNSFAINPTFALYSPTVSSANFIGTAVFNYTLGAWTRVFTSTNPIVINDNTNASPYPALIDVSGVGSSLVKATVTLTNLTHTDPYSIGALVESPAQKSTLLMGHAGNGYSVNHVTITFDDAAGSSLPQNGQIVTGTNKPSGYNYIGVPFP